MIGSLPRHLYFVITLGVLFLGGESLSAAAPKVEKDIVFGKGGDVDLKLDLYQPADLKPDARYPGIVAIYGGGWRQGAKENVADTAELLAEKGYVVIAPQYRLTPQYQFPAQVNDVKAAVRWLRANADKYQVDPNRIGAIGYSAGGHLSLMLGVTDDKAGLEGDGGNEGQSSKVQAVVNYFGPTTLLLNDWNPQVNELVTNLTGGSYADKQEVYEKASPLTHVSSDDAPVLTFHGTRDALVPYAQAVLLDRALRDAGVESELDLLTGTGHGWKGEELDRTQGMAVEFFDKHLKPKAN